jgi:hypothetical protein
LFKNVSKMEPKRGQIQTKSRRFVALFSSWEFLVPKWPPGPISTPFSIEIMRFSINFCGYRGKGR